MRLKFLWVVVALVCFAHPAWAQVDVFGGYSLLNTNGEALAGEPPTWSGVDDRRNLDGWLASVAVYLHNNIAAVGEFGGQYKGGILLTNGGSIGLNLHTFMGGVRVKTGSGNVHPFAHALVGQMRRNTAEGDPNSPYEELALGFGGGIDIVAGNQVSFRAFQADWVPFKREDAWRSGNFRLAIGIVINAD